ncbi:MAG: hypothetical protein ACXVCY_02380 [Pseudobdellovibrionaceae bacterium]
MKALLSSLVIIAALLTGCSKGGGNDSVKHGLSDLKPTQKPQNPVQKNYLNSLTATLVGLSKYLPDDAVIFDTVLDGTKTKYIYSWSSERTEAKAKLNNDGLQFATDIKAKCLINNADSIASGGQPKAGSTSSEEAWLSTTGNNCPYIISRKNQMLTTYNRFDVDNVNRSVSADVSIGGTSYSSNEVKDERLVSLSGIRSIVINMKTTGYGNFNVNQTTTKVSSNTSSVGSLEIHLANGDYVTGPVTMESITQDSQTESQILFDGKSSQGDIRVVVKMKTGTTNEVYLNGEKIDLGAVGGLGFKANALVNFR